MNEIVHFVLIETTSCFHTPLPLVPLAVVVCFRLYFGLYMCVCACMQHPGAGIL